MQLSGSRAIVKRLFITLSLLALLFATVKILAVPAQKISPPNSDYLFIIKKGSSFNDVIEKMDSVFNLNSLMWTKVYYKINIINFTGDKDINNFISTNLKRNSKEISNKIVDISFDTQ